MKSKTTVTLGAAVAALGAAPALAAPPSLPVAASYAELLEPIPDAVGLLRASDAEAAMRPAYLIPAQYDRHHHHHHHHHHSNDWYRQNGYSWNGGSWILGPPPHHHHHHHHSRRWYRQNGYIWNGGAWVLRPAHHHHHHHHHHHSNY